MLDTDVAIVGGGLAGSLAAAMLGRAGYRTALIDPHQVYPVDFRCEKLDGPQVETLRKTGLADAVLRATTHDRDVWVARYGRLLERRPSDQYGILYQDLVNTIRAEIPADVNFLPTKATALFTGRDRQRVATADGQEISTRLIVLANGLNVGLRHSLGLTREEISHCHSISIGFDLLPLGRPAFDFRALTYYTENVESRAAYITLFPIGTAMRANLFVYRDMQDPWLKQLRDAPEATLHALMPRLHRLTGDAAVNGFIKIRPVDLYVTNGYRQPGIVLVGDAFATSCPAAGTGARKVLVDVERLCNMHIPQWLETPGMDFDKIASFYADPVKMACDTHAADKAFHMRSMSIDPTLPWQARRLGRFAGRLGFGMLRRAAASLPAHTPRGGETLPSAGDGAYRPQS